MKYPRGSEWRRWDLHVHTPLSIVQQYGGNTSQAWDAFIAAIAALPPDISVLAINDYLFVDGYEKVLERRGEIPNITMLLPSIEFRLDTFSGTTESHKRHNFHVLFDPSVSVQTIREQLLNSLSKAYKIDDRTEWNRTPTIAALTELGAMMRANAPAAAVHNKTDLQLGFESITYDRDDILAHLQKDCFKGKYLLGIGYSEWDQARWDQSAATKRDLINKTHFALTNNDDINKISEHVADLERNGLNSLLLHSSDSHALARLGKTKLWIKADPTFAGLKQVINEPERVFTGDEPPRYKSSHQVIDKISIRNSNGWFEDQFELAMNEGLIAIIGGRGSGKSALAEMIACGAGTNDPNEDSFVNKAIKHSSSIRGAQVELTWSDGETTTGQVGVVAESDADLIKYLPQKAVETLCSPKNSATLVAQIESVIFQALDETIRLGASDFPELKDKVLQSFEFEKTSIASSLQDFNAQYEQLDNLVKGVPAKKKELESKRAELIKLNAELPKLPEEDEKAQNELANLVSHKKAFEDRIVALRTMQEQIATIQTRVKTFAGAADAFGRDMVAAAKSVGIVDASAFGIVADFALMQQVLSTRSSEIQVQIDRLKSGTRAEVASILTVAAEGWTFNNYDSLVAVIEERTKATKAFESQKLKFQQQKLKITQTEKTITALTAELEKIEKETIPQRKATGNDRLAKYVDYFSVLEAERVELAKLYGPLQASLDRGSETDRRLRFEAKLVYNLNEHLSEGLEILDRTKRGNFREIEALKRALGQRWDSYVQKAFSKDAIKDALTGLWGEFTAIESDAVKQVLSIEDQLRDGIPLREFFDWFLDVRHFNVTSSLTFDGTDLYLLSPGQKGIVLLMLYLGMDKDDTRPLVIDQPEDNLDNLSVYRDLIGLFKSRKQWRQILVVTHNPNLVVNTDAEQVVVAAYEGAGVPRIGYDSGSLENQAEHIPQVNVRDLTNGIIEQVCDVLEGGPGAFEHRSKVYSLSPKIN